MWGTDQYDAVVVGSGPNGLAGAICLALEGWSVLVLEGKDTFGGGIRSAGLTLEGYIHDVCSAIYPLSLASPFLSSLPLEQYGLKWIHPDAPLAHPLDGEETVVMEHSIRETASGLGEDGPRYRKMMEPLVENSQALMEDLLGPLPLPPKHPLLLESFSRLGLRSASGLAKGWFKGKRARALFAGNAAHSILSLKKAGTAAFGVMMGLMGHSTGWPMVAGGAQNLTSALCEYFLSLGGEIRSGIMVKTLEELPNAQVVLLDITPQQLIRIAGKQLPEGYCDRLKRYRYGAGVFKIDYALGGSVPWINSDCNRAATVHLGGTLEEIIHSEREVWYGRHTEKPFVLFVQQSLFDPDRAPPGKYTAWAYCHVPNGSTVDMTQEIEHQIERFAPGFRDLVLARHTYNSSQLQSYNPNYIGGDIIGGAQDLRQQFFRPVISRNPYKTPLEGVYLCSSSTPPGGGVHCMCGYHAAQAALKEFSV